MAVNLKIDRDGNVQEVGTIVTTNVALQDSALEQVRKWKFKPFVKDGNAVQVNTYLAIPYEAKVELLGSNSKSLPVESFFSRIENSRKLSDPRTEGFVPFHLKANLETNKGLTGVYEETWISPTKWRREVQLGALDVVRSQSGDKTYPNFIGADHTPKLIDVVFDHMTGRFPKTDGSFIEGDWGQSAVLFEGMDTVRIARGAVDEKNQPISDGAYWFDSAGLLRGAYVQPQTTVYRDFGLWDEKQIPRKMEVVLNGKKILTITIEQIETARDGTEPSDFQQ
jgi:Gram-negative bacterial TonB protein C-terminal